MASGDTTRLVIELEVLLRNLNRTLRGLDQVKQRLQSVANVRTGTQQSANINRAAAATQRLQLQQQRAAVAAQRLSQAQQAVGIRAQQLANAQTRAQQATQRLVVAQQRLNTAAAATTANLGAQADSHVRAFRAIERASRQTTERILGVGNALRSVGQGLASVGATLTATLTVPLLGLGAATVNAAVELDSLKRGLTAIVGSSEEAGRQLQRLTQIAKLPGIGFQEAIQGSIRLQAVGFSAKQAEDALRQFSNAVALTGGGRDELNRVTVQLGQMAAKGKILSQDLRPIIESAPAVGRALLEAFGTVNPDDIRDLGLSSRQFIDQLVAQLGQLPRAAAGAKNSFENFRDELFRAAAVVGETVLPALTRLAEVVGPIITGLANAFAALPQPLQVVVIGFGALVAILGPALFIIGQLTLGAGRLLVGFAQLNAAGILPTVASLRALTTGSLSAAAAQRTLAASTALVAGGVGAVLAVIATVVTAFAVYRAFQKDSIALSREQVDALDDQVKGLKQQAKFLEGLKNGVTRTADEQDRLLEIYEKLNTQGKIRITGISDEEKRLAALREELAKIIALREQERVQAAARLAAIFVETAAQIKATEDQRTSIAGRIQANTQLIEAINKTGSSTGELNKILDQQNLTGQTAEQTIDGLGRANRRLLNAQEEAIKSGKELNDKAREQAALIQALERQTGLTARQLLVAAQSMGVFRGDIETTLRVLERYIDQTIDATRATDEFTRTLNQQQKDLDSAGEQADQEAKRRRTQISAAAALARESANSFEDALKFLNAFIAAQPRLRADIERERQIQGKSLSEFLEDALEGAFKGRAKSGTGTSLRNAQEQLAQSLADVAQASADEQATIEKLKNDSLLRQNENAFKLQLVAYRQYLSERARLTGENLQLEINALRTIAADALAEQGRLSARASQSGVPQPERVKAQAGAAEAEERAVKARTKILELEQQQKELVVEVDQLLRESAKQQIEDTRKLEIEYAELKGNVEDALNAATDERFRQELEALTKAQDDLNKRERLFADLLSAEQKQEITLAKSRNQRQIDTINNIIRQERATNQLAAANELVRRAKEKHAELERDLAFQVQFRGLAEENAIIKRLEGERRLVDSLRLSRDIVQSTIDALNAQGIKPSQALFDFIREVNDATRGLGELPFSEQFRLAQKEFDRINDERITKIEDVERAVRNRDIAEIEGAIIIRRINNQYTADLEAQLALLKQIAGASHNRDLQRQAADAGEVVKDTKDDVASLGKQIESAGKDAFRSGLTQFFNDLANGTATAKEALLGFLNSMRTAINDVIAEHLSKKLFESIFGGADEQAGGLIATIKRLFGFGGGEGKAGGTVDTVAGKATDTGEAVALQTAGTATATALTTAGTAAGAALTTGATAASTALVTSLTAAATAFASSVIAAGAAFAAAVGVASGTQVATGGLGSLLGNTTAATGMFPAVPGGVVRIVEGGYPEAVLTTDPKHATRQMAILKAFLRETRGLGGRIRGLATGGFAMPELSLNVPRVPLPSGNLGDVDISSQRAINFRNINLFDKREMVRGYLRSAEGAQDFLNMVSENAPDIGRRLGVR